MSVNNVIAQLKSYVESHHPMIYIDTYEDATADKIIKGAATNRTIYEWNLAGGIVNFYTKVSYDMGEEPGLASALEHFNITLENITDKEEKEYLFVLKDAHHFFHNPEVIAKLRSLIHKIKYQEYLAWVIVVSPVVVIPQEIEKFTTILELELPDREEIAEMVREFVEFQGADTSEEDIRELSLSLKGLSQHEIEMLLYLSYQQTGYISKKNKDNIHVVKEQIIRKSNIIEMVPLKDQISDIGGLDKLKNWLGRNSRIFNDLIKAQEYGIETPKGLLIMGMPGCGKSLAAKATAHLFNVPLLRLDIGKLMGKYVGESEANMRRAIKVAEAISPCVLWIDEIEKAFAGVSGGEGGGGEVTTRLFGTFLTWMQEKTTPVFVVATANNINKLPPEMMRKGRFDELFFVDFPNTEERKIIFEIHLNKRKHNSSVIDLNKLSSKTEGYCGADIEAVVKEGIVSRFLADSNQKVQMSDIENAIKDTVSLKEMLKDKIDDMEKKVKNMRIKPAT